MPAPPPLKVGAAAASHRHQSHGQDDEQSEQIAGAWGDTLWPATVRSFCAGLQRRLLLGLLGSGARGFLCASRTR
jgi:hypothetical protein